MTGPKYLLLGLALAAMGLIVLFFSWINDSDLSPGNPTTLVIIGLPAGIVLTVIGLVKIYRDPGKGA